MSRKLPETWRVALTLSAICSSLYASPSPHFELFADHASARGGKFAARMEPGGLSVGTQVGEVSIRWAGANADALTGEDATGGRSNYYTGSDPSVWRTGIEHFRKVRQARLYPGIDLVYRFADRALEFDLIVNPGANPGAAVFETRDQVAMTAWGGVRIGSRGFELKKPVAWQEKGGQRTAIDCRFEISRSDGRSRVAFRTGAYDRTLPLIIDPVVEYATYLGGTGADYLQATGIDAQGNAIVSGVSSSTDFPAVSGLTRPVQFIYVTKLAADGSSIAYTTVLGSGAPPLPQQPFIFGDQVNSIAVDALGAAYVSGLSVNLNLPVTPGAWQTHGLGFVTKLDAAGRIVYSTWLGNVPGGIVKVRNGIAYVAGRVASPSFAGTPGAFQTTLRGVADLYALALTADGSAALFETAVGGSGNEILIAMDVDAGGDMLLAATTDSTDFPLAPGEFGFRPAPSTVTAVIARLNATGSALLDSTYLGTDSISSIALSLDGARFIAAGLGQLPASLIAQASHTDTRFGADRPAGWLAEFATAPLAPVWTRSTSFGIVGAIGTDAQGNIYSLGGSNWVSGGSTYFGSESIVKLAADGSVPEAILGLPAGNSTMAVNQAGQVAAGLSDTEQFASIFRTTSGVLQPEHPVKSPPLNPSLPDPVGFLMKFDTAELSGNNFFARTPQYPLLMSWRIGEPAPLPLTIPVQFTGTAIALNLTSTNPVLTGAFSADALALSIGIDPGQTASAASTTEYISVSAPANPAETLQLAVALTVKPAVSITPDTNQVTFHSTPGQSAAPVEIGIIENFGAESFGLTATPSDPAFMSTSVFNDRVGHAILTLGVVPRAAGTYDYSVTVGIDGLQQGRQIIQVHYVVDSATSTLQLSPTRLSMTFTAGQQVQPGTVNVTSSTSGLAFKLSMSAPPWLNFSQSSGTTPAAVQFTADSNSAPSGSYTFTFLVTGADGEQISGELDVLVVNGPALAASPAAITYTYFRSAGVFAAPGLSVISTAPTTVKVTADKPWILPSVTNASTPFILSLNLDTSLPEGFYQGNLVLSAGVETLRVLITYTVSDAPGLVFSTAPVVFNYQIGDSPPPARELLVTSSSGRQAAFLASPDAPGSFLDVTPSSGLTPATLTLNADVTALGPGVYQTQLNVKPGPNTVGNPQPVPVILNVMQKTAGPSVTAVTDAASYRSGAIAPGQIVVLWGSELGPANLTSAAPEGKKFPVTLAGTTVTFNGLAVPVIYTSAGQVSAVAPFEIANLTQTVVSVWMDGTASPLVTLPVVATSPAIFTADASGSGQAAALRVTPDGTTALNNAANAAAAGDIITLYATGLGSTTPGENDGELSAAPLAQLNANVQVSIGGHDAEVLFAGPAPTLVAGAYQINARVPAGLTPGNTTILIKAGGNASQPRVTIATR